MKLEISRDNERNRYHKIMERQVTQYPFHISITTQIIVLLMYMVYKHILLVSLKAYPGMVWLPQDMSWLTLAQTKTGKND